MSYTLLLFVTGAASLAVTLNTLGRRGGLSGIRLGLVTFTGGATLSSFALLGASVADSAETALPFVALVRVSAGLIGAGFTGTGLLLLWPERRWTRAVTIAGSVVVPLVGAGLVHAYGPGVLLNTHLSWFPGHPAVRAFDSSVIFAGTLVLCAGAIARWRASRYGRVPMVTLLVVQTFASTAYFLIRIFGAPELQSLSSPVIIAVTAFAYWIALERWRVAGMGESGLALVFSRMPLPAMLLDLQTGRCITNPAASALVGPSPSVEEVLALVGLGGRAEPGDHLRAHDGTTLCAVRLPNAPEQLFDVSCHFDAQLALGLFVLSDVTERAQHAERLGATVAELRATQDRLVEQEKIAALGVLVAGVNHEINNPLAYTTANLRAVKDYVESLTPARDLVIAQLEGRPGATEALRQWADDDGVAEACHDATEALTDAIDGCTQIREIVGSMRMLSRQQGESQRCCLSELTASGLKIGGTNLSPSVHVHTSLEPGLHVRAVPGEVMRVMTNLVVNAGQALGEQGNIHVRTFHDTETGEAVLEVSDDGPGIPPALQGRIFDAFFTTKAPGQGTGLGLAISAETARRHGGSLRLVPKPGRGATFQLRLPLEDAERDGTSPELTAPVVPAAPLAAAERF